MAAIGKVTTQARRMCRTVCLTCDGADAKVRPAGDMGSGHGQAQRRGADDEHRRYGIGGESLPGVHVGHIVVATRLALIRPPVAMAMPTATSASPGATAPPTRSSAAIFGVSFRPRAKLTAPALA